MTAYTGGERVDALSAVPETRRGRVVHVSPLRALLPSTPPPMPSGSVTLEAARSQGGATRRWRAAESVAGARPVPATHPGGVGGADLSRGLAWSGSQTGWQPSGGRLNVQSDRPHGTSVHAQVPSAYSSQTTGLTRDSRQTSAGRMRSAKFNRCWLGRKDSNLQPSDPESAALPLRHSPSKRSGPAVF